MSFLINEAVKKRSKADVPVGLFLSGGIDSSIILSSITSNLNKKINCFTIGFENKSFDETEYSSEVASFFDHPLHVKNSFI